MASAPNTIGVLFPKNPGSLRDDVDVYPNLSVPSVFSVVPIALNLSNRLEPLQSPRPLQSPPTSPQKDFAMG
jgi:hypothetical protein